jgi:hypothetical protein
MAIKGTNFALNNGTRVKSHITGFAGMITCRADHLYGCNRYYVTPPVGTDGKLPDGYWFDEAELDVVEEDALSPKNNDRGGFPSMIK